MLHLNYNFNCCDCIPVRRNIVFRYNSTFTHILFSYELKCKYAYKNLEICVFTHSTGIKLFGNNGSIA
jgi:hypothetical protein